MNHIGGFKTTPIVKELTVDRVIHEYEAVIRGQKVIVKRYKSHAPMEPIYVREPTQRFNLVVTK